MDYWLGYLPIKKDKAEAKEQHEFLVKWFRIDSPAFNPATNDGLHRIVKILRVFAELYNTKKMVTSSLKKQIEKHIRKMMKNEIVRQRSDEIWSLLSQQDKTRLLEIEMKEVHISE